ncbi:uncharacterized protein LOC143208805 [Lasioglossum baleicum]|uniref:uncharacterized protein LOC143208805 n=1 Tax=Lasioglossum baleicum TaxID=434251 RepID=UPI003FCD6FA0
MCRSNFRIKLDLCKFYNDVRRFCWIFVDSTRMLHIAHAMDHITKLFSIKEPFHLLLNEAEYLPPNEDIRVLKENETILVCPGTGLQSETDLPTRVTRSRSPVPEVQSSCTKTETVNDSVVHKESQTQFYLVQSEPTVVEKNELIEVLDRSQSDALETSTLCERTEDETNSTSDSKVDGMTLTDFNIDNNLRSKRKRKRTRKKKTQEVKPSVKNEIVTVKPKIINTYVISTSKHIRFDNLDSPETVAKPNTPNKKMNGSYPNEVAPSHELANLLSLGHNPTPVTFTNSQVKEEIKLENMSDEETRLNASLETKSKGNNLLKKLQERKQLTSKDLEACPILLTKPELKCVIAFKMLKIGSDYTPQVSEFIVAEVVSYCPKSLLYTFKVLHGVSEVQVPVGKFTLIEDEEELTLNDTITINIAQLIEPRIVSAINPDRVSTPTAT